MDNLKRTTIILASLLVIAMGYIIIEKADFCEPAKNESYSGGFNQGVNYWNTIVMYNVNNNNVIPYWFNKSYFELPISQMCGEQNANSQ